MLLVTTCSAVECSQDTKTMMMMFGGILAVLILCIVGEF